MYGTYVGLNVEEAKKQAQKEGYFVAVYKKEEKRVDERRFLLPDRLNFVTEKDIVVSWTIG